jgi:hypothetical protein
VFITRASGGRFEMAIVTFLTTILFFTSSLLLPYVPTILASALVLFLGMELLLEAVWESARTLVLLEWSIVMATLLACTFLGFGEGFAVGIGAATVVYLVYGVVDSVSHSRCFLPRQLYLFPSSEPELCSGKNGMKHTMARANLLLFQSHLSAIRHLQSRSQISVFAL